MLGKETISAEDLDPAKFVEDQRRYLDSSARIEDDVCRTAIPLASIPWMEAILGCPIHSSGTSLKSKEILDDPASLSPVQFDPADPWIRKYLQFIDVYHQSFGDLYPIGQSVIRGPSDLACALLGAENATMALVMEPEAMRRLLGYITDQLEKFLCLQLQHLPVFQGGYVIGQYEIWAPQPVIRIQEDFSVLYSPQLYDEFLRPLDERLAGIVSYSLMHLHSSSLFLIDNFLEVSSIKAFQVSKDAGTDSIAAMLPGLKKIQQAERPIIIKGVFDDHDLRLIRENLSVTGLCLQPVVSNVDEAEQMLPRIRRLWGE
ncbi:MAG: hypothetical protein DRP71_07870 [Verrucomicrobia bacterium]|nr:MAG: hypothetical protein DRP71_07870 [Verrucomicrobiota bacterium]